MAINATPTIGTRIAAARTPVEIPAFIDDFGDAVRVGLPVGEPDFVLEGLVTLEELDDLLEEVVVVGVAAACSISVNVIAEVVLLPLLAVRVIW